MTQRKDEKLPDKVMCATTVFRQGLIEEIAEHHKTECLSKEKTDEVLHRFLFLFLKECEESP